MITYPEAAIRPAAAREFGAQADASSVRRSIEALEAHGMTVIHASDGNEARRIVLDLIPDGSGVHRGASLTLDTIGIGDELERVRALHERQPPDANDGSAHTGR